jgi:flagellin
VQSETGTNSTSDISNLNQEFAALAAEVDRLADDTTFNGINVMKAGQTMSFAIGADESDTVSVSLNDFNLANGGATAGEVVAQNTAGLVAAQADLRTDLASGGSISIDDGDTTISINLTDIIETANDESLLDTTVSQAQIAAALDAKAAANENFSARITATSTTGFTVTEKAGQANSTDTYSLETSISTVSDDSFTMAAGTSGTTNGVLGADLSAFSNTGSISVNTTGTIAAIDTALDGISSARATIGSAVARLEFTVDSLSNASLNNSAAKSRVMDADYAAETTELARSQIIAQASTAMLSQANQQAQSVLALLK